LGMQNTENQARWVEAHWEKNDNNASSDLYEAQLKVIVIDRIGLLADISVALSDMKVFILQINKPCQ